MTTLTRGRPATTGGRAEPPARDRSVRRMQPPGWRDLRLVVGLLLVLLSVAGGSRLVASLDDTTPVYAAAQDLLPGQPVSAGDLTVVDVRLDAGLDRYVDGTVELAPGTHLLRGVGRGELVPAASLGTARQALDRSVSIPVDAASAGALATGAVVDLWVSERDEKAVGEAYLDPLLLLPGVVVDRLPAEQSGLGAGLGRVAVQIVVPADRVGEVVAAVDQEARLTLVPTPRPEGSGR